MHNANLPSIAIGAEDDINVARAATVGVFEADFCERRPVCAGREKEVSGVVGDEPVLAEAHRAGDGDFFAVDDAANAKRVLRFVFSAIGDFVVERAQALGAVARCGDTAGRGRKAENFGERMFLWSRVRHDGWLRRERQFGELEVRLFDFGKNDALPVEVRFPAFVVGQVGAGAAHG